MKKQDKCKVRQASDLEQKYDLGGLAGSAKSNTRLDEQVRLLNQTLAQHIANSNTRFEELEEIETIGTHFYSGVPSLFNEPASSWNTDELKQEHIGDMYYDTDNGHIYLFKLTDDVFEWVECFNETVSTTQSLEQVHEITDVVENTRLEVTLEPELPEGATLVSRYVNTINADANTDNITFANFIGEGLTSNTFVLKSTSSHTWVNVYVTYFYTLTSNENSDENSNENI